MDDLKQRLRKPDTMTIDQCFACMAEAAAALDAKDAELAALKADRDALRALLAEADRRIVWEGLGFGNSFAERVEAALSATTKE
jgi:hypothetical protein